MVAFNTAGGWARDVSEEIGRAVADQARTRRWPLRVQGNSEGYRGSSLNILKRLRGNENRLCGPLFKLLSDVIMQMLRYIRLRVLMILRNVFP